MGGEAGTAAAGAAAADNDWASPNKSKDVTTLDWNGEGNLLATVGRCRLTLSNPR
jgi:hypothetical protein